MPLYRYKAKQGPTKTVEGELTADSRGAALGRVEAMGLNPISIEETTGGSRKRWALHFSHVSNRDVTVFTRQLGSLTKSGVPILRSLATVQDQTESEAFRRVVEDIKVSVRDGNMLSDAIRKHASVFPDLYVNMVRAGESAGVLDTILFRLADSREKEEETRRKVEAAIAYPLLVLSVGLVTVFVLLAFFLPRIIELFRNFKIKTMPLPTRILIGLSDFMHANWYWLAILAVLVGVVIARLAAIEKGRLFLDRFILQSPVVGRFVREADIARFCRTLALVLGTGVPIEKGLVLSMGTLHNTVLKQEAQLIVEGTVQQGRRISEGLKKSKRFPAFLANMAAVGEEGGRLEASLDEVAAFYEKEVEQRSRMVTSLIEPILILGVGGIVGFIVAAMLLPIFELSSGL